MAYSVLLLPLTLFPLFLPAAVGGAGMIYGVAASVLSGMFLALALRVGLRKRRGEDDSMKPEKQLFAFSILYLFALFAALVVDRWLFASGVWA
jgi:protoheme IX farnesyltransferase